MTSMHEVCAAVPREYNSLFSLYAIFLTLPVTTSTLERRFSKMAYIKSKLRSTMGQDRLEALLFMAAEQDISLGLSIDELVAKFSASKDRRMMLG